MKRKKILVVIVMLALIATTTTVQMDETLGVFSSTAQVVSMFEQGDVATSVDDESRVWNTGNAAAYVRVALVPVWADGENQLGRRVQEADYRMVLDQVDWFEAEGYYYYKHEVRGGAQTTPLIESFDAEGTDSDCFVELQIICSGIQSVNDGAVETAWSAVQVVEDQLGKAGGKS